jgi:hypothetical protein
MANGKKGTETNGSFVFNHQPFAISHRLLLLCY